MQFSVLSSQNIDITKTSDFIQDSAMIQGEDTAPIFILPIGIPKANTALDNAIKKVPGCIGLMNGTLENEFFSLFVGYQTLRFKGNCLIDPKLKASSTIVPPQQAPIATNTSDKNSSIEKLIELKKLKDSGILTPAEYEGKRKEIIEKL
jgi:hypothetical protein